MVQSLPSHKQAATDAPGSVALTLAGHVGSVALARDALRTLGEARGWESADAELVVSELVTNAVRHGEGDIHVILTEADGLLSGEVIDHGPGFERKPVRRGPISPGRWGLVIVADLTQRWGTTDGASRVWFEMAVVAG